jgi:hypothetical protein
MGDGEQPAMRPRIAARVVHQDRRARADDLILQ